MTRLSYSSGVSIKSAADSFVPISRFGEVFQIDPVGFGDRVAFCVASPRNHKYYTVKKPFAGGEDLSPGKGLRTVRDRVNLDRRDVALQ